MVALALFTALVDDKKSDCVDVQLHLPGREGDIEVHPLEPSSPEP